MVQRRKREAATNLLKPHAHTYQLCSVFQQGSSKIKLWLSLFLGVRFTPEAQTADTYLTHSLVLQWRETNCALKASTHCIFDIYFRTILLRLKASLPALPRPSLMVNGPLWLSLWSCATNTLSEESHPRVLKTRPRCMSSLPMQFLKIRLAP